MSGPKHKTDKAGGPDWSKFGLEGGEKQPLNPGTGQAKAAAAAAAVEVSSKEEADLFGGQVQHDSELFADDQGSRAAPWWRSHFLVSERVLFGTWDGVFTSCLINIFGVIVFLRSGWIVAEAGIGHAALIVLTAVALVLMAVLSAIGICERCHVQSGGVYFLISHVLGARTGAAVGIIYVMGQAIGNALCATGFAESIAGLISTEHSPWAERSIAAVVILLITLVNLGDVKWVIRLQFVLLVVLLLGAGDFVVGSVTHKDEENGFYGWNMTVWKLNSRANYTEKHNWFSVFGVFFPAITGVMAGINMSGDLRNPSEDISIGTLTAVAVGSFLYLTFMIVLAGTCDRAALLTNYMIAEKVSALGFLLLAALYLSSISSCVATLFGTPRVLQSIASENPIQPLTRLADGKGPNKVPVNALLTISVVTLVFIAVGEMNRLATLTTMPFLMTYGMIEYSYFVLCMQFDLNQQRLMRYRAHGIPSPTFDATKGVKNGGGARPKRRESAGNSSVGSDDASSIDSRGDPRPKGRDEEFEELLEKYNVDEIDERPKNFYSPFCNKWISLTGVILKVILMFLIHWGYSLLCIAMSVGIWFYLGQTAPGGNPGIAAEFSLFGFAKNIGAKITGRGGVDEAEIEQPLIVNPIQPTMETRSTRLNEVNSDFADRSQFHQAHNIQGKRIQD